MLGLAESTFRQKAASMGLYPVEVFAGRKGRRFIQREVIEVAERAIRARDERLASIRKTLRLVHQAGS